MSRFSPIVILGSIIWVCGLIASNSAAQIGANSSSGTIHIEADRMESDQRKELVTFAGNVEAVQGELVIQAEQMIIHYRKSAPAAGDGTNTGQNIESLEASGDVRIEQQDWRAAGDRMEYQTVGRTVVLTGNTKVWRDSNMVVGDRVVLYLDEGKSVVESQGNAEGGRVKAFFYPDGSKTEKEPATGN